MKKTTRRRWAFGGIFLLLIVSAFLYALPLLRTATGYSAKMLCSCIYVQNHPGSIEEIQAEKLNFSILGSTEVAKLDKERGVTASFFGLAKRKAVFVEGRGCVLISDENQSLPATFEIPQPLISEVESDLAIKPDSISMIGVDTNQMATALDFGMERIPGGGALAIVVLKKGKVIAERYDDYVTPATPLLGWSMTKSLTAGLVGMRVGDGAIDPDKKPVFNRWAGTAEQPDLRAEIPLWNLLQMNSGLQWAEDYGTVTDATIMLYDKANMAGYVKKKPVDVPPGEDWKYSSGTTNLLMGLVRESFSDEQAFLTYLYDSLFLPIGANSFIIESDQSGLPVGSSYGWATARDWAKMGQLWLQNGQWNGKEIIPADWVAKMRLPAAGSQNTYGGQIWLKGPKTPHLPDDAFAFQGFQGQRVYVLPTQEMVIVRLGHNNDKATDFDGLIERVLKAVN